MGWLFGGSKGNLKKRQFLKATMTNLDKSQLVRATIEKLYVSWAYHTPHETKLKLGDKFEIAVWSFLERRDEHRAILEAYLKDFDEIELRSFVSEPSFERSENRPNELNSLLEAAFKALEPYNEYLRIGSGLLPEYLPDYKMWGMRDRFEAKELTWLSIGFEPTNDLINGKVFDHYHNVKKVDALVVKEAERRREIIKRSSTLELGNWSSTSGDLAYDWLNSIDLTVPEGFKEMLLVSATRLNKYQTAKKDKDLGKKNDVMDPRALRSASRLIAAMAMDGYGWQTPDKRSPIPGELEAVCDRLGLPVSRETILKYLRTGSAQLPKK